MSLVVQNVKFVSLNLCLLIRSQNCSLRNLKHATQHLILHHLPRDEVTLSSLRVPQPRLRTLNTSTNFNQNLQFLSKIIQNRCVHQLHVCHLDGLAHLHCHRSPIRGEARQTSPWAYPVGSSCERSYSGRWLLVLQSYQQAGPAQVCPTRLRCQLLILAWRLGSYQWQIRIWASVEGLVLGSELEGFWLRFRFCAATSYLYSS